MQGGVVRSAVMALVLITTAVTVQAQDLQPRELRQVFAGNDFEQPLFLTHAGDGTDRVFILEKPGTIKLLPSSREDAIASDFLVLNDVVNDIAEGGLLGLAFHPDYRRNGLLYVNYTHGNFISRVSEFRISANPDVVDRSSERVLLDIDQPAVNHNGGQVTFGPDRMLYIGFGDGGAANDRFENGQDPTTLLAAILRIDVDARTPGLEYGIPEDNPFVGNSDGWREEIWAYGLRNPWRFSFDRVTGDLWAGDVGQGAREEVDLIVRGGNYGWNTMEGFLCFNPSSDCNQTGLVLPVIDYNRQQGVSVTGGYVYRGRQLGELSGTYLYGDWGSKRIWGLRYRNGIVEANVEIATSPGNITSFGEDAAGEIYAVGGGIFRIELLPGEMPTAIEEEGEDLPLPEAYGLQANYPNPFNAMTTISYSLPIAGEVELTIFDLLGRRVATLAAANGREAGRYAVNWDGLDDDGERTASGLYFYRLSAPGVRITRKMLLLQ